MNTQTISREEYEIYGLNSIGKALVRLNVYSFSFDKSLVSKYSN
jgi:hypothetical protein